jgi:NADH dehydrogenase FAD-containing subunit
MRGRGTVPVLAQHTLRAARVLAGNIAAALDDRPPRSFVSRTLGLMGSLGHGKGSGQFLGVRVRGFPAWFIRRIDYLLQMPGWGRKLRIVIDRTLALLFLPDIDRSGLRDSLELARSRTRWPLGRLLTSNAICTSDVIDCG